MSAGKRIGIGRHLLEDCGEQRGAATDCSHHGVAEPSSVVLSLLCYWIPVTANQRGAGGVPRGKDATNTIGA